MIRAEHPDSVGAPVSTDTDLPAAAAVRHAPADSAPGADRVSANPALVAPGQPTPSSATLIELVDEHSTHNYHPLPVVIASGEGAWVRDVEGNRYLDALAAYSAVNFGHSNPTLLAAAREQLDRLTLTSRAFHNDQLGPFVSELAALLGKDLVLPMNTGAEAVESAIKVARAWGYRVKGVKKNKANIVVMSGNFHGRTTTIVSFSDDPSSRNDFGPFTPGFKMAEYGKLGSVAKLIDKNTVAVLVEPIQGEAGVILPPENFLPKLRKLCSKKNVLLICDEIQSGLGRTGHTLSSQIWGVEADLYTLGKALGGGIVPVSAVVGNRDVLGVLRPGEHGSTFGGNPLAAAVGRAVVRMLATGEFQARARQLGEVLEARLLAMRPLGVTGVRVAGLWAGIDIDPLLGTGRDVCEGLMRRGVLAKDTHGSTIRLAPPLMISRDDLEWALDQLEAELRARVAARSAHVAAR